MKLKIIPAKTGVSWVREGLSVFAKQPLRMTSFLIVYILFSTIASIIPAIGVAVSFVLMPFLIVVLMVAAARVRQNSPLQVGLIVELFKEQNRKELYALAMLGIFYAVFVALLVGASTFIDGGAFLGVYTGRIEPTPEMVMEPAFQSAFWMVMLLGMLGSSLMWFAPGLIYWFKASAPEAMLFSAKAFVRNFGAVSLYMLAWGGVAVVMVLAVMFVLWALVMVGVSMVLASFIYLICMLMFTTAMLASAAFAVRDNFEPPEQ